MKIHWVLPNVTNDDIRMAFEPYGEVMEATKERWRVLGISEKATTTRVLNLRLKAGVTIEDIPYQVRVAGEPALVVIPGKAPLCLRCQGKGHIRRDCRIPRCSRCRRFGHDETQCVPTYANITGPRKDADVSDNIMDEAEAEEVAATVTVKQKAVETPPAVIHQRESTTSERKELEENATGPNSEDVHNERAEKCLPQRKPSSEPQDTPPNETSTVQCETMDGVVEASTKRMHSDSVGEPDHLDDADDGGPPMKTALTRRTSLKPKPNILSGRRPLEKPPE